MAKHKGTIGRRPARRLAGSIAGALAVLVVGAGALTAQAPAAALPPFPLVDAMDGESGELNTKWAGALSGTGNTGHRYTPDKWLRLTNSNKDQATNILYDTAFPSSMGFTVDFDYRQAGGATHSGDAFPVRTGDGISMYLVDGAAGISAGANGGGLGYSGNTTFCGVTGGYLGVGLDAYGSFSKQTPTSFGGTGGNPSLIGIRGSGTPPCVPNAPENYPWVDGAVVPNVWTGTVGNRTDPATMAESMYRHVRVSVTPSSSTSSVQVTISISGLTPKFAPYTALTEVLSADLASVAGQAPLPETLKLGFAASTGGATDFHDIRNVRVTGVTDVSIEGSLAAATPGNPSLEAAAFRPGDDIAFDVVATNNGPSQIGDLPDGFARIHQNLSDLPLAGITWTCTGLAGAVCLTPSGTGAVASSDWVGPSGSAVRLAVNGRVAADASAGDYTALAVVPTDFTDNTVNPARSAIQADDGLVDVDTTNNTARIGFTVVGELRLEKTADKVEVDDAGETITYTFAVTNPGVDVVTELTIQELSFTGAGVQPEVTCPARSIEPGETVFCTAIYNATEDDVRKGRVENTAMAVGQAGEGRAESPPSTAIVDSAPQIRITSITTPQRAILGTSLTWTVTVMNPRPYPLANVSVTDMAAEIECPRTTLAPDESMVCTVTADEWHRTR